MFACEEGEVNCTISAHLLKTWGGSEIIVFAVLQNEYALWFKQG